jgi:hypothetical protein
VTEAGTKRLARRRQTGSTMSSPKDDLTARLEKIQPVSGIRAIAPTEAAKGASFESASTVAEQNAVDRSEALAFEEAGWKFARNPGGTAESNVVVDNDGRLKIVTDALNVKFEPSVSRGDVESILKEHGLSVRRDMKFSPNLFTVSGAGGGTVEKAKTLNNLDKVLYAEPVLIEALGRRSR